MLKIMRRKAIDMLGDESRWEELFDAYPGKRPASAEEVADRLRTSKPTAFRYLRQLCEAGMLTRLSGRYALGPRIIQLDRRIRLCDPILLASRDALKNLASLTGCSAVLSSIYGDQVIMVHRERGPDDMDLGFDRGSALPLFRGAASKVILAHLTAARLKRIYESHGKSPDAQPIGADWTRFSRYFRECRRNGYYLSRDELELGVTGISAPIFNSDRLVIGSLTLVFESRRGEFFNEKVFGELVSRYAREVSDRLAASPGTATAGEPPAAAAATAVKPRQKTKEPT